MNNTPNCPVNIGSLVFALEPLEPLSCPCRIGKHFCQRKHDWTRRVRFEGALGACQPSYMTTCCLRNPAPILRTTKAHIVSADTIHLGCLASKRTVSDMPCPLRRSLLGLLCCSLYFARFWQYLNIASCYLLELLRPHCWPSCTNTPRFDRMLRT